MGSRWIFYPYHFAIDDEDVVVSAPNHLTTFVGSTIDEVVASFREFALEHNS
jgi:hypothetical protein